MSLSISTNIPVTAETWVAAANRLNGYTANPSSDGFKTASPRWTFHQETVDGTTTYYMKDKFGAETSNADFATLLQAAIDAFSGQGGGIMLTGQTIYYASSTIKLKSYVSIYGEAQSTQIQATGDFPVFNTDNTVVVQYSSIIIRNLYLTCAVSPTHPLIDLYNCEGTTVETVIVDGTVSISSTYNGTNTWDNWITHCNIRAGSIVMLGTDSEVSSNRIGATTVENAITAGTSCRIINNNIFSDGTATGILLYQVNDTIVLGNIISGLLLGVSIYESDNCSVKGNTYYEIEQDGININDGADNLIVGETFISVNESAGDAAVSLRNGATGNTITGCKLISGYAGVKEASASDYTVIQNNDFAGASGTAITLVGTNGTVNQNVGFKTENSGATATVSANSKVIAHGLAGTPQEVFITVGTTGAGDYYTDTIGATEFTVHFANSGSFNIYWHAIYKP